MRRRRDCLGLPRHARWLALEAAYRIAAVALHLRNSAPPRRRRTDTTPRGARRLRRCSLRLGVCRRRGDGARTRHAQRPRKLVVRGAVDDDFNELARREVERQDGIIMKRGYCERCIAEDDELLGAPEAVDKRAASDSSSFQSSSVLPRGARSRLVEGRGHERE